MAVTKTVSLGECLSVTVRELTVAEVRDWAVELGNGERKIDIGGEYAFDGYSLDDLLRMSNAKLADLECLTPSELAPLAAACQEVNPHFFKARAAVDAANRALLRGILSGPSSPLSNAGTA